MKKFLYLILIAISSLLHAENWTGTGWALKGGYIVTNFHCVDGAESIVVRGSNNFNAEVVAVDKVNDLAIIKINDSAFRGFGEIPYSITRKQCELGESVWTLGYPMMEIMGEDVKFTDGRISSKTGFQGELQTYQITVPIQPGNSGGALFNQYGNVVGVTSSGLNKAIADNVNYAIKTIYLLNLIESKLSTDILPTGNTSGLSLTDKIKKIRSYVFPLYFSGSSKGSIASNNSGTENGHEYVDLGLSSGTYWKETNESGFYNYDNAVSKFGNKLPTKEQLEELKNECEWTWTGNGYKVTGPNGESITLPAAGSRYCGGGVGTVGTYGGYWSSTPNNSDFANLLDFNSIVVVMRDGFRCNGFSVRLVKDW